MSIYLLGSTQPYSRSTRSCLFWLSIPRTLHTSKVRTRVDCHPADVWVLIQYRTLGFDALVHVVTCPVMPLLRSAMAVRFLYWLTSAPSLRLGSSDDARSGGILQL